MRNRHGGSNLGLVLLAAQVYQLGLDNIPPVTLGTLGLNVYLFLFPVKPISQTCVSVQEVFWNRRWQCLLLSPFHHVDDIHLYFNMASLLWKGIKLERRLGGHWFAYLLCVFSLLEGLVYLLLEVVLTQITEDTTYSLQCAVGFSGVLFALKVVHNHYESGRTSYIMGVPIASRYACWAELVLIHILCPGTSFVGHLSGILVGLLYTKGPLKSLMKTCADFVTSDSNFGSRRTFNSSGSSGFRMPNSPNSYYGQQSFNPRHNSAPYRDPYNTDMPSAPRQHPAGLSEEEQNEAAIGASLNNTGSSEQTSSSNVYSDPIPEVVRLRRLQRFTR
ncbi:rhomboid-related protein 4-like [Paramisgurnus dabryanus]|uniref:rhomboid-related protein 4-like n=1 Tax=Paramisgurnus dabryanus TaxID=90735 RepID=UPI0031F3A390